MFLKISQLIKSIKEIISKADAMPHYDQPVKRVTYRLPSNIQGKERSKVKINESDIKSVHEPMGEGRITPVQGDSRHMINQDPRPRKNPIATMRDRQMKDLGKPSRYKKAKSFVQTTPTATTKTQSSLTRDPGISKITPEQSQPKKLNKQESPAIPPEGNSQGQKLDYKYTDASGKKYGANRLEEDTRKKKRVKEFFRKSLPDATITLSELEGGDMELEVVGALPVKIESAIKKIGFVRQ